MTEDQAVEWMAAHGHTGYRDRIASLKIKLQGYASAEARAAIEAEIAEEKQAAYDRYDDWKTDPLD